MVFYPGKEIHRRHTAIAVLWQISWLLGARLSGGGCEMTDRMVSLAAAISVAIALLVGFVLRAAHLGYGVRQASPWRSSPWFATSRKSTPICSGPGCFDRFREE
jgi:hypothetical protein